MAVRALYYPKFVETRPHYDQFKYASGGYGGLMSIVFHSMDDAQVFYDSLRTEKGPSLGTNFTLR
jgi:cystathionine gamma-synthase